MTEVSAHDCHHEIDCIYDGERYSVRDNGAVLRHPRTGKRPRPTDNKWTFGKPNHQNYMLISQTRIHRIVATAFYGEPPTPQHVVDHIDTNRQNNRPENLRWLTRLENVLLNPITVKRIEFICGSIEAFLDDPSILGRSKLDPNFGWMRTVSSQEAQACRERMHLWAQSDKAPSGGSLGEWIYKPLAKSRASKTLEGEAMLATVEVPSALQHKRASLPETPVGISGLVKAKTPGAAQRKWRTPTEFPCCPQEVEEKSLAAYAEKLKIGAIFSRNDFLTSMVLEAAIAEDDQSIWVMCEQADTGALKPWSLAQVTYEDGLYVHTGFGTFFSKEGAEKQFCLARGLEWAGGDSIDDYC